MKNFRDSLQFNLNNNEQTYAGFFVRFTAAIIDIIITTPLILAIFFLIGFDVTQLPTIDQMLSGVEVKVLPMQKIADFISWTISIAYSIYFLTSKKQATIGKRIMNIYVATKDGQKLSVDRAFARFFASILSGTIFGIGFIMIAFTKEKTALHDLICNTRVFYGKKN